MADLVKITCDISKVDAVIYSDGSVSCPYIMEDTVYEKKFCTKRGNNCGFFQRKKTQILWYD